MPERPTDELSALLKRLRVEAGMSGPAAAARVGFSQSSISRYERGLFVPSVEHAAALASAYEASAAETGRLLQMVRDLRENATPSAKVIMQRAAGDLQERIGRIEASSVRIRTFYPVVLPGLLQTEAYLRTVFASGGDLPPHQQAAAVAARLRRQEILDGARHEFVFVVAEGALRWQMGGPDVMVEQLRHIDTVSRRPNVRFGVIPWTVRADVAPMHGFDLYDERAALVGTETATAILTSPPDVVAYVKLFADLESRAVFGDDSRRVVTEHVSLFESLLA